MPIAAFRLRLLAPAVPLLVAACSGVGDAAPEHRGEGATGEVGGTLVLVVGAEPNTFFSPRVGGIVGKQVSDLVYERLADIGPGLNVVGDEGFEPRLARSWAWSDDSLSITFELDPEARWHDGRPVRSDDVRFTFEVNRDPAVASMSLGNVQLIDSVTTPDSLHATFWFRERSPEQFYDAAGRLAILPEHLLGDVPRAALPTHELTRTPVGSGPFRFVRHVPGSLVELAADPDHHLGRPLLDRVILTVASTPATAVTQLLAGDADMYEALQPSDMPQLARSESVVAHLGPGHQYSFAAFNTRDRRDASRAHPILGDREVRRALTMLVDRETLVRSVWDSLAVVGIGPFPRTLPTADTTLREIPHDPARGRAILDSLGWRDRDGDGVRERDGQPLTLSVLVPTSSPMRQRIAVILQDQLRDDGVRVSVEALEFNAFVERMGRRDFDLTLATWVLVDGSPSGARNTWGSLGATERSGQNFGRWVNPVFDTHVDSGLASFDHGERRRHFSSAYQTAIDDAPAVWLYEARNAFGIHRRFRTPPIRSANWWLDLHRWWIPAGERIERDRAGLPGIAAVPSPPVATPAAR
ncbi:MAG TPA: peptide ABC transporter substrate-binding protein [Gemmatimonadales bacterium]